MNDNKVKIPFNHPLLPQDTPIQTFGCRANNPNICLFADTSFCAFKREDNLCYKPSRAWKKQYEKLRRK